MIINPDEGLTFADVLLVPQYSELRSRDEADTSTQLGTLKLKIPIISASMSSITGEEMGKAMSISGGLGVYHRYVNPGTVLKWLHDYRISKTPIPSVGVGSEAFKAATIYRQYSNSLCIDIAHGHCIAMKEMLHDLEALDYENIIAGNVATWKGAADLYDWGADIVKVGVGPGCLAKGTRIMMGDGSYKNIEDIKIHDRVINMNGEPVEVISTRYSGIREVISHKSNFWYKPTNVTPDHEYWIGDLSMISDPQAISKTRVLDKLTKKEESKYKWLPIGEASNKHYGLLPNKISFDERPAFSIDMRDFAHARRNMKGLVGLPVLKPNYELGYLIGSFLGDGHASVIPTIRKEASGELRNNSGRLSWYFNKIEGGLAGKVALCLEKVFGVLPKIDLQKNMFVVKIRNNYIVRFFETMGKKTEKHLPLKLRSSVPSYVEGLLDGLVDSDGHYSNDGRIGFTNTSTELIELFMWCFFLKNGYYPSCVEKPVPEMHHWGSTTSWKTAYVGRSVTRPDFNDTMNYQVAALGRQENQKLLIQTYDIEVDCPTHSFIADNAIVHNSACSTRSVTGHGVAQLTAIQECAEVVPFVIADGGFSNSGDIVKALAAGADAIMTGYLFIGCNEAANPRLYEGMASASARKAWTGKDIVAPEGILQETSPTGRSAQSIMEGLAAGIRSGMSYSGARTLAELRERAIFQKISHATTIESGTRV